MPESHRNADGLFFKGIVSLKLINDTTIIQFERSHTNFQRKQLVFVDSYNDLVTFLLKLRK